MTKSPMKERPLSPHLQVYRLPLSAITSILHRVSGVALIFGFAFVVWGLVALADGRESYEIFIGFLSSILGQIILIGLSGAFYYHLCTGVRHLFYDMGYLLSNKNSTLTSAAIFIVSIGLTLLTWAYIYLGGGV